MVEVRAASPPAEAPQPQGNRRACARSWSQVAAFSHSPSVGRRAACALAKASASNQETWTTGSSGSSGAHAPVDAPLLPPGRARRPGAGVGDVVALLPGPALVRPPLAAPIAAALDEPQERRVGDRRAADPEGGQVGAVARALVVVGEDALRCAERARAARDLDGLEAGVALGAPRARRRIERGAALQARERDRLQHRLAVLHLVLEHHLVPSPGRARRRRAPSARARARPRGSPARRRGRAAAGRRARGAASRTRRTSPPAPGRSSGSPPRRCTSHRSS